MMKTIRQTFQVFDKLQNKVNSTLWAIEPYEERVQCSNAKLDHVEVGPQCSAPQYVVGGENCSENTRRLQCNMCEHVEASTQSRRSNLG